MRDSSVYLLPPRPRRRDWLTAGLTAGATLALMELLVAIPGDLSPPPPLALLLAASDIVVVTAAGLSIALALEVQKVRLTHSGMVGAMLGPLIGAALPGAIWGQLPLDQATALGLSGLAAVALFALAAGLAGSRLCEALENSGVPVSAPLIWGATALSMASGQRILAENPGGIALAVLVAAPGVALLGIVAGHERARRLGANLIVQPSRALGWVGAVTVTTALMPWIWPWLFYDDQMPELEGSAPSFVMVALDGSDTVSGQAAVDVLGWDGVTYHRVDAPDGGRIDGLLSSQPTTALFDELSGRGYATHAVLAAGGRPGRWRLNRVDDRPGPGGLLAGPLRWMAGSGLWLGPAASLFARFGFGGDQRTATELADAGSRWLLSWRTTRAPAPFFLALDFRNAPRQTAGTSVSISEQDINRLIDALDAIGVTPRTALLGWFESDDGVRATIRPPAGFAGFDRSEAERASIDIREWAQVVREIANADTALDAGALP